MTDGADGTHIDAGYYPTNYVSAPQPAATIAGEEAPTAIMDPHELLRRMLRAEKELAKADADEADAVHAKSNELRKLLAFQIKHAELAAKDAAAKRMKNAQKNNEDARKTGERVNMKVQQILKIWPILAQADEPPSQAQPPPKAKAVPPVQVGGGDDELDEVVVDLPRSPSPVLVAAPGGVPPPKNDSMTSLESELDEIADDGEPTPSALVASLSPTTVEVLAREESLEEGDVEMGHMDDDDDEEDDNDELAAETDAGDGETDAGDGEVDGGDMPEMPDDGTGQKKKGRGFRARRKRLTPAELQEAVDKALAGVRAKAASLLSLDAGAACFTTAVTDEICAFIKAGLTRVRWHKEGEVLTLMYEERTRALTTRRAPPSAEEVVGLEGRLVMLINTFHTKLGVAQHTLGLSRIVYSTSCTYTGSPPPPVYNECLNPVPTAGCLFGRVFPAFYKSQIMHARPTATISNLVMVREQQQTQQTPAPAAPLLSAAARGAPFLLEPDHSWLEVADCSPFAEPIVDTFKPTALTMVLRVKSFLIAFVALIEYLAICWPICACRWALRKCCGTPGPVESPVEVQLGRMVTNARWQAFYIARKASLLSKIAAAKKKDEWPVLINATVNSVRKAHADAFYRAGKARSFSCLLPSHDLGISGFTKTALNLRRELLCTTLHNETAYWLMVKVYVLALMVAKDKQGSMSKALKSARRRKRARVAIETVDKVASVAKSGLGHFG